MVEFIRPDPGVDSIKKSNLGLHELTRVNLEKLKELI
jgi:hypothetical protein